MKILFYFLMLALNFSTYGQFVQDSTKTCKYWMPYAHESFELSWSGKCKDGLPHGTGTLRIGNPVYKALEYTGRIEKGKFTGQGKLELWQTIYEGNFTNGHFLNLNKELLGHLTQNPINQIDSTDIFVSLEEKHELFYYSLIPANEIKGVLVLLPSLWERPELVLSNNVQLCELAFKNGIALIVPSINYNVCLTDESTSFLNKVFKDAIARYKLPREKIILGGFSLGGMNSLRYTELGLENAAKTEVIPKAVFGVDPPVNFTSLYDFEKRALQKKPDNFEAKTVIEKFDGIAGGSPLTHKEKVEYFSVYSDENSNAKFLKNIPVRIYCDPDIDWWMDNRGVCYRDLNAVDQTAFIIYLKNIGNEKAEFINRLGKGYRLDGKRHPHSWSLLEPQECMTWILKNLN